MNKDLSAAVDPTLPFTEVEVAGRKLRLCLTLRALAAAEAALNVQGRGVKLLVALPNFGELNNLLTIFACSLHHYQPEISFDEAMELPTASDIYPILEEVQKLWLDSTPKPPKDREKSDPPPPEA